MASHRSFGVPSLLGLIVMSSLACASAPATTAEATPTGEPPRDTMMAHVIYAPDPDQKALQRTPTARFTKTSGSVVIGFCIDVHGNTTDVEVNQPFPGDPMIDGLLLETVATWRYTPFIKDGRPIKTCSEKTFNLRFSTSAPQTPPAPAKPLGPLPDSRSRDVCVHLIELLLAAGAEPKSEAEAEQALHRCFEVTEAERQSVGDENFERKAKCVLAVEALEQVNRCSQ